MKKSSSLPLVIIVLTFLVIPVAFWFFTFREQNDDIRGVGTRGGASGVIVRVNSNYGTWDMSKYLCPTREECSESLVSGKILETTSGGGIDEQFVIVRYTQDWESYEYLKVFIKPGWGSPERVFNVSLLGNIKDSFIDEFTYEGEVYKAVIIPIQSIGETLSEVAIFSDQ